MAVLLPLAIPIREASHSRQISDILAALKQPSESRGHRHGYGELVVLVVIGHVLRLALPVFSVLAVLDDAERVDPNRREIEPSVEKDRQRRANWWYEYTGRSCRRSLIQVSSSSLCCHPVIDDRSTHQTLRALSITHIVFVVFDLFYFIFLWRHPNHTYRRSAVALALAAPVVLLALLILHYGDELPEQESSRSLVIALCWSRVALSATAFLTQVSTVVLCTWLLFARWRYPNLYEPVVPIEKGDTASRQQRDSNVHMMPIAPNESQPSRLSDIYRLHEGLREQSNITLQVHSRLQKRNSIERARGGPQQSGTSSQPNFEPAVRFRCSELRRSVWRNMAVRSAVVLVVEAVLEPVVSVLVVLVWRRISLDTILARGIRLDMLLAFLFALSYALYTISTPLDIVSIFSFAPFLFVDKYVLPFFVGYGLKVLVNGALGFWLFTGIVHVLIIERREWSSLLAKRI
ncbi:hypothetical protein F5Y09DRAFT_352324 [Xylaria sp. FL1042]|nr:hypothetical protein F5Y09DRAFT_352324 [Xylaria sp. FL1042]